MNTVHIASTGTNPSHCSNYSFSSFSSSSSAVLATTIIKVVSGILIVLINYFVIWKYIGYIDDISKHNNTTKSANAINNHDMFYATTEYKEDDYVAQKCKFYHKTSRFRTNDEPFNPFTDFHFSPVKQEERGESLYSSFDCVGSGRRNGDTQGDEGSSKKSRRPNFVSRTCYYRNLYYRIVDQSFHYFASPTESLAWSEGRKVINDATSSFSEISYSKMDISISHVMEEFRADQLSQMDITPWRPHIHEYDHSNVKNNVIPPNGTYTATTSTAKVNDDDEVEENENFVFLLYRPFHSMNVGHLLWDDFLSLFSLLDLFGLGNGGNNDDHDTTSSTTTTTTSSLRPIPFFVELPARREGRNYGGFDNQWRCSPWNEVKWNRCVETYKKFFPPLFNIQPDLCSGDIMRTGNWLLGDEAIGVWPKHAKQHNCTQQQQINNSSKESLMRRRRRRTTTTTTTNKNLPPANAEYILLRNVIAGTGRLGMFGCDDDCSVGRGPQLYRYRNFLYRQMFGKRYYGCEVSSSQVPPRGYITFSLPVGSSRPNEVYFFHNEIQLAKEKYGRRQQKQNDNDETVVQAVDMSSLSIKEQVMLASNTAVLITNHGGGSMISTFLQRGCAVLVFWHGDKRLDHAFYESAGYFRTTWISYNERAFIHRTMALIDREVEKTAITWPEILCAKERK